MMTWDSHLARKVAEPAVPLGQMQLLLTLDSESGGGENVSASRERSQSIR